MNIQDELEKVIKERERVIKCQKDQIDSLIRTLENSSEFYRLMLDKMREMDGECK